MKRALIPPHRRPEDQPSPPPDLYQEPENDIELLGEMLHDIETMGEKLRRLPFERDHYRADLRVVRGAAVRMADRCARLLDEVLNLKTPEASNKIDVHPESPVTDAHFKEVEEVEESVSRANASARIESGSEGGEAGHPPQNSYSTRKNGRRSTAVPIAGGLKAAIVRELKEGPKTSTELIEILTKDSGVRPDAIHETLAKMRVAKEVTHQHMGRRIINRLA